MSRHWRIFGFVLSLVALICIGTLTPVAHAEAQAGPSPTPTPAYKVPAGYHVTDPNYVAPKGMPVATGPLITQNTCIQPPSQTPPNVRHDQLTDAQIAQYDMLPRSSMSDQKEWAKIVDADLVRDCSSYASGITSATNQTVSAENEHTVTSSNWAGYYQLGNSGIGNQWNTAASQFYVPSLYSNAGVDGDISSWVGMGGYMKYNSNLVQGGADGHEQYGSANYYAWTEDVAEGAQNIVSGFPVAAGQLFYAEATIDFVYIEDITNGHQYSRTYSTPADPHSVDCILEWPNGFSQPQYQPDFFTQCEGNDGASSTWIYVGCNTCDAYVDNIMVNRYTDSTPSTPPSAVGTFDVVWNNFN
jgi:hypothetical protein